MANTNTQSPTNTESKFSPLSLRLENGRKVTGIHFIPPPTSCTPADKPLMIGIHGGTCFSRYFDLDSKRTASLAAVALGIPFIAIDRPGYGGTSSIDYTGGYVQAVARFVEDEVLPALWKQFGVPNNCSAIILYCHSLGSCVGVITASLHSIQDPNHTRYPLAGLVYSGIGRALQRSAALVDDPASLILEDLPETVGRPTDEQEVFMLGRPELSLYDRSIRPLLAAQNGTMMREEIHSGIWFICKPGVGEPYIESITCPVMFALPQHDGAALGTVEEAKRCAELFKSSRRVDYSVVRNAPHAMEWAKVGNGWYMRVFGWAMEATADFVIGKGWTQ